MFVVVCCGRLDGGDGAGKHVKAVVVIDTDPKRGTAEGGAWWDVAVTDAPRSSSKKSARAAYERARKRQALGA